MIDIFVKAWDENKNKLEEYFKSHKMEEYSEYNTLVKLLFEKVINPYLLKDNDNKSPFNDSFRTDLMTEIDDGDYQGDKIYLIPQNHYQPSPYQYVFTYNSYGSCSGCDTLLAIINGYEDEYPIEGDIKYLMTLCLHLLQRCRYLIDEKEYYNEI